MPAIIPPRQQPPLLCQPPFGLSEISETDREKCSGSDETGSIGESKLHFPCIGDVMVDFDRFLSGSSSADCYRMQRLEVGEGNSRLIPKQRLGGELPPLLSIHW